MTDTEALLLKAIHRYRLARDDRALPAQILLGPKFEAYLMLGWPLTSVYQPHFLADEPATLRGIPCEMVPRVAAFELLDQVAAKRRASAKER